jgi:Fe2+ or Zn2+ uptake regulation protein
MKHIDNDWRSNHTDTAVQLVEFINDKTDEVFTTKKLNEIFPNVSIVTIRQTLKWLAREDLIARVKIGSSYRYGSEEAIQKLTD